MRRGFALALTLVLAAALTAPALAAEFTGVPASRPFHDATASCSASGIVGGYNDGTFQPAKTLSKNHFCAMLARAFFPETAVKYDTDQCRALGFFAPSKTPADVPAGFLTNGKPIAEENVTEILDRLKAKYNKRDGGSNDFSRGYAGLGSGSPPAGTASVRLQTGTKPIEMAPVTTPLPAPPQAAAAGRPSSQTKSLVKQM